MTDLFEYILKGLSDNPLFSDQHKAAFSIAIHDIKQRHDWDINNLILINKDNYEPFKPMVEIDLDYVIKQKYIEREVLDKIRAEIAEYGSIMVSYAITKDTKTEKGIEKLVSDVLKEAKEQVLEIIDKYRAESEVDNGNVD